MIEIKFTPEKLELEITGHAGYAEPGKDIVCASVSVLFCTLIKSLDELRDALEKEADVKIEENRKCICCIPKEEFMNTVQLIYWTVLNGLQGVALNYPEYIKFLVVG